jgi:hypothetical protein
MVDCPTTIDGFWSEHDRIIRGNVESGKDETAGNRNTIIKTRIAALNSNMKKYVRVAGIGAEAGAAYTEAQKAYDSLVSGLKENTKLNNCLANFVRASVNDENLNNKLTNIGKLNKEITNLQKNIENAKHDLEVSRTRQKNIQESEKETTLYQGFSGKIGFLRPLKKSSVPILIALGIVMVLFTALLLKEFFTPTVGFAESVPYFNTSGIGSLFTNERFYSASAGFISTVIIVGVLAYYGYLGTSIQ